MLSRSLSAILPLVPRPLVGRVASRYVAGTDLSSALATVADLERQGCLGTVALLGEELRDARQIEEAVDEYLEMLDALAERDLPAGVSVKPTHVGLLNGQDVCYRHLERLVGAAAERRRFVRIDMEDHTTTDATLSIYRRLRKSFDNVGVVLQAYLHRTVEDAGALPADASVRVCKGIYVEPRQISYHDPERIRESFVATCERLFERDAFVAIATHDAQLLERCREIAAARRPDGDGYELQMLLGVTRGARQALVAQGERVRVYVPYGPDWYDYSLRRLRENPRIAVHVLKAVFGSE